MKKSNSLKGKFIHTFNDETKIESFPDWRVISKQGWLKEEVAHNDQGIPTAYMVQWFEWGFGQPANQTIETVERMIMEKWSFYETEEQWRDHSDRQLEIQKYDRHERLEKNGNLS